MKISVKAVLSSALFISSSFCASAMAGDLTVTVTGISESKGDILIAVFNKQTPWLKTAVLGQKTPAKSDVVELTLHDLPEGEYAISAFHDLNQNGQLDTNAMGIPNEPYGFSNDAAGNFGPPSFEQAKFVMENANKVISIRLN